MRLIEGFRHQHGVLASMDTPADHSWRRYWYRAIENSIQMRGPQGTFPYEVRTVTSLVGAYRASGRPVKRARGGSPENRGNASYLSRESGGPKGNGYGRPTALR
jgi:hypothetical protein